MTRRLPSIIEHLTLAVEEAVQDSRHAWRNLRRSPGTAVATVVILGVAMTICTTLLSLTQALVFRPLPVSEPARLVAISLTDGQTGGMRLTSYETFRGFLRAQTVLDGAFAFRGSGLLPVQAGDRLSDGVIAAVTPEAFTSLGLVPSHGRFFTAADAPPAGEPERVIVLSHRLWRQLFDARPDAIGATVRVRDRPLRVIGVMPEAFPGLEPHTGNDLYVPVTLLPHLLESSPTGTPNPRLSHVVGHLRAQVTIEEARAAVATLWPSLQGPASTALTERIDVTRAGGGFSALRTRVEGPLGILTALAFLLLAIGTVNLYALTSVRFTSREGNVAILLALGAPQFRLLRVLAIESLVVAAAVILLIVTVSPLLSTGAVTLLWQGNVPVLTSVTPGGGLLGAVSALVVAMCLAVGVMPALWFLSAPPSTVLQRRRASVTSGTWHSGVIIVTQVALSVVLVATAALFVASLWHLRAIDTGFRSTGLVFGRASQLPGPDRIYDEQTHYPELVKRLASLPGIESVAMAHYFPAYLGFTGLALDPVGAAGTGQRSVDISSLLEFVSPGFFDTVGSRVVSGRDFTWNDRLGTTPVVIVNESLARQLTPDGSAVGMHIRVGAVESRQQLEVVGVAADLAVGNLRSPHLPVVFRPRMQEADRQRVPILLMRTSLDATSLFEPVDRTLRAMGHERVRLLQTIDEQIEATLRQEQLLAGVGASFGIGAVLVTLVGVFALLSHAVSRRTQEIGLRRALGATRLHIVRSVVQRAARLTLLGLSAGVPAALAIGRLAESLLFGVLPGDPWIIGGAAVALCGVAGLASLVPAWRATRVDAVVALRAD